MTLKSGTLIRYIQVRSIFKAVTKYHHVLRVSSGFYMSTIKSKIGSQFASKEKILALRMKLYGSSSSLNHSNRHQWRNRKGKVEMEARASIRRRAWRNSPGWARREAVRSWKRSLCRKSNLQAPWSRVWGRRALTTQDPGQTNNSHKIHGTSGSHPLHKLTKSKLKCMSTHR